MLSNHTQTRGKIQTSLASGISAGMLQLAPNKVKMAGVAPFAND
jgi:hypothetical protein